MHRRYRLRATAITACCLLLVSAAAARTLGAESRRLKIHYKPTWESLSQHGPAPRWYEEAVFGIYFHWGVYSVPAFGGEKYARNMYREKTTSFKHHCENYGHPTKFGYHDFIPMFRGEHWNPQRWAKLFKHAGADFAGSIGEHHDGFAMWDTEHDKYNAMDMGPRRDVVGEMAEAVRGQGMKVVTTFHHLRWDYFDDGRRLCPPGVGVNDPRFSGLYGPVHEPGDPKLGTWLIDGLIKDPREHIGDPISEEFREEGYQKFIEVIDKYRPDQLQIDPHFEQRPPQVHMLRAVAQAFNQAGQLLVEAGTGVGKSLAYLIPAVYYAVLNSTRVVISTNTINLQDQLFRKDLPDLLRVLSANGGAQSGSLPDLRVAVLKGRTNYVCVRRLAALRSRRDLSPDELRVLARILVWMQQTQSGDQSELFLPTARDRSVWRSVAANNESCQPDQCWHAHRGRCYFYEARRKAETAHLIVVNHALLLSDVAVANRVLPEYRHLIIDEAHQLEAATTHQLSFTSDERHLIRLLDGLSHRVDARSGGLLPDLLAAAQKSLPASERTKLTAHITPLQALVGHSHRQMVSFFDTLHEFVEEQELLRSGSTYSQRIRVMSGLRIQPSWSRVEIAWDDAADMLRRLADGLHRLSGGMDELIQHDLPGHEEMAQNLADAVLSLREQASQIGALVSQPEAASIYWIEVRPPEQGRHISLHVAPLHIGPLVDKYLLMPKDTVILTSATLRTAGDFEFIQERLHAWEADTLAVGSPFDYANSTLLYLPSDIPEPNAPGYQRAVERTLGPLIAATRGRTLALFTSYSQLRRTAAAIAPRLADEGITLLQQGAGGSRAHLLESFRSLDRAALLGTRSFWEGVDVLGSALSCLVIARLPFSVPTDPVYAARSESFDEPFYQYSVPETILRFRQAFGRLIRSKTDRGVVVVLDRRVQSKAYGRFFLESLPECTERRGPLASLPQAAARWIDRPK